VPGVADFGQQQHRHPLPSSAPSPARPPPVPSSTATADSAALAALREQVAALQAALAAVRADNDTLRAQRPPAPLQPAPIAVSGAGDAAELERQLRDRTAQLQLARARFEHLDAKAAAERGLYDRAVNALEEQNAELRRARSLLQASEADLAMLRSRLAAAADAEEELRKARDEVRFALHDAVLLLCACVRACVRLRSRAFAQSWCPPCLAGPSACAKPPTASVSSAQIRRLEATVNELASAPFERGGLGGGSSFVKDALTDRQRLQAAEAAERALRDQVAHLQATVRGTAAELQALRRERADAAAALETAREEAARARAAADAAARANTLLRERLALYSGGAGLEGAGSIPGDALAVPVEELERALALVRRRLDRPADASADVPGLTGEPPAADDAAAAAALRRKVQQLQLALLTAQSELDRCERLQRSQAQIGRDLAAEVADLHGRLGTDAAALRRALADTQACAEERLQRIHMLEAEVAQLLLQAQRWRASRGQLRKEAAAEAADAAGGLGVGGRRQEQKGPAEERAAGDDGDTVISGLSEEEENENRRRRGAAGLAPPGGGGDLDDSVGASSLTGASEVYDLAGPGDNRLEVAIKGATLDPAAFGRGAQHGGGPDGGPTTFALVDLMDFESPRRTASRPCSPCASMPSRCGTWPRRWRGSRCTRPEAQVS